MSEYNENDKNITNNEEPKIWSAGNDAGLPQPDQLTEEDIYRILQDDAQDIEPPASLSPAQIEKKLQNVVQDETRKRSKWVYIAGMAACLVFGVMAGLITFSLINRGGDEQGSKTVFTDKAVESDASVAEDTAGEVEPEEHEGSLSYDEVCDIINKYNAENRSAREEIIEDYAVGESSDMAEEAAPATNDSAPASDDSKSDYAGAAEDYSDTDKQVEGVDEGDIVKTDGKHIFTVEPSTFGFRIHVIEPNGNKSKEIGRVEIPGCNCEEMYLVGDRIFAIGLEWRNGNENMPGIREGFSRYYGGRDLSGSRTVTTVVDISDPSAPKIEKTHTQTGRYNTSRISDRFLYVFTEDWYERETDYEKDKPEEFIPQIDGDMCEPGCIVRAGDRDINNYMVMTSLSVEDPDRITDRLAVLGGGATYYVSTENIYIARPEAGNDRGWFWDTASDITSITKFRYNDGKIKKVAETTFRGSISDSYYMHEYQGNFCFVYTSRGRSGATTNGLCVVDGDLKPLGEIDKIGVGEQIYASYFIDNMAYFVTYRNTDPVFAVDISDPTRPELKSELKLPGFSSYLHSFGTDKLIGIGYGDNETDGMTWDDTTKISLFEIGKDYDIKELSKVFAEKGARNIADFNHKAVFVDEDRELVGFALMSYDYEDGENTHLEHYVVYKLKGDKLVKVMDEKNDGDVDGVSFLNLRGVRIGETFYVCDPTGVQTAYAISGDGSKWKKA